MSEGGEPAVFCKDKPDLFCFFSLSHHLLSRTNSTNAGRILSAAIAETRRRPIGPSAAVGRGALRMNWEVLTKEANAPLPMLH